MKPIFAFRQQTEVQGGTKGFSRSLSRSGERVRSRSKESDLDIPEFRREDKGEVG